MSLGRLTSLLQMLEIRIHSPGNGQYRPTSGSDRPINLLPGDVIAAGQHDLIKLISMPAHFEQVLDQEWSRDGRGKLLVSGKVVRTGEYHLTGF